MCQYLTRFLLAKKNYNYVTGYLCDDYKVKSLRIMLPKTKTYEKSHDGQKNWMYFLIQDDNLLKKI